MRRFGFFFFLSLTIALLVLLVPPTSLQAFERVEEALEEGTTLSPSDVEDLSPSTSEQHANLARVLDDPERAADHYLRAMVREPDPENLKTYLREYVDILILMGGEIRLDSGLLNEVIQDAQEVLDQEDWIQLARVHRMAGDTDRARSLYQETRDRFESTPEALLGLVEIALVQERFRDAEQLLDVFVRSESTNPTYWYLKGRMYELQDEPEEARLAYQQIVDFYSGSLIEPLLADVSGLDLDLDRIVRADGSPADSLVTPHRIQLGSFQDPNQARSFRREVEREEDRPVVIEEAVIDGNQYFRVQLTGFSSSSEAEAYLEELEENGRDGFYLRVDAS